MDTTRRSCTVKEDLLKNVSVDKYISTIDNKVVVHIDTYELPENNKGPMLRIYLNDDTENPLWDNTQND